MVTLRRQRLFMGSKKWRPILVNLTQVVFKSLPGVVRTQDKRILPWMISSTEKHRKVGDERVKGRGSVTKDRSGRFIL